MKSLALSNPSYRYLEQSFKEWLDVLGYAPTSVYGMPLHVRELLHHLESKGIRHIKELDTKHIKAYYQKLKERSNQRRGGGLSNSHLNKHIQAIKKFSDYLRQVGRLELPAIPLHNEEADSEKITVVTEEEIKQLFAITYQRPDPSPDLPESRIEAIQSRDRAMLAIYYGCGLRRNEGVKLDVGDINFDRSLMHVRKGKNYKERFVPISKAPLKHLQEYVYDHRAELLRGTKSEALLISLRSRRVCGATLLLRLKYLQQQTGDETLKEKEVGLHTLRHSIATHLLSAGMELESISRFLGHSSLESTQIYTHLAGVEQQIEQPYHNTPRFEKIQLHEDEF
jgi:integrase/recombinase XerD